MSVVATMSVIASIASLVKGAKDTKDISKGVADIYKENKGFIPMRTNGSITKLLKSFIVEPIAVVDSSLRTEENIDKILELNADIFSGYYTQAFDVLVKVYGIDHKTVLSLLSTDNISLGLEEMNTLDQLLDDGCEILSIEANYHQKTPDEIEEEEEIKAGVREKYKKIEDNRRNNAKFREELLKNSTRQEEEERKRKNNLEDDKRKRSDNMKEANINRQIDYKGRAVSNIEDDKNISSIIQKKINIEILLNNGGITHTMVIPMLVKLNVKFISPKHILEVVDSKNSDKSFGYRLDEYKSGAISLSDLVFGNDLIKKYRENQLDDHNELMDIINFKTANANSKIVTQTGIGYEKYFNLLVVSTSTKASIERAVRGKISKTKYKEKVLESTNALMMTVVDEDYERVIIYTKDIDGVSDITFKALSKGTKDSGMNDIFKALVGNRPPVL